MAEAWWRWFDQKPSFNISTPLPLAPPYVFPIGRPWLAAALLPSGNRPPPVPSSTPSPAHVDLSFHFPLVDLTPNPPPSELTQRARSRPPKHTAQLRPAVGRKGLWYPASLSPPLICSPKPSLFAPIPVRPPRSRIPRATSAGARRLSPNPVILVGPAPAAAYFRRGATSRHVGGPISPKMSEGPSPPQPPVSSGSSSKTPDRELADGDRGLVLLNQLERILERDALINELGFVHPTQLASLNVQTTPALSSDGLQPAGEIMDENIQEQGSW